MLNDKCTLTLRNNCISPKCTFACRTTCRYSVCRCIHSYWKNWEKTLFLLGQTNNFLCSTYYLELWPQLTPGLVTHFLISSHNDPDIYRHRISKWYWPLLQAEDVTMTLTYLQACGHDSSSAVTMTLTSTGRGSNSHFRWISACWKDSNHFTNLCLAWETEI